MKRPLTVTATTTRLAWTTAVAAVDADSVTNRSSVQQAAAAAVAAWASEAFALLVKCPQLPRTASSSSPLSNLGATASTAAAALDGFLSQDEGHLSALNRQMYPLATGEGGRGQVAFFG